MAFQGSDRGKVEQMCEQLGHYFGSDYEISSNSVDVVTIRSGLKASVYVESEDILIVDSIANDHGLSVEKWRIVVANQQVGIYFVLSDQPKPGARVDLGTGRLTPVQGRATA
jgi:hypothetical protein